MGSLSTWKPGDESLIIECFIFPPIQFIFPMSFWLPNHPACHPTPGRPTKRQQKFKRQKRPFNFNLGDDSSSVSTLDNVEEEEDDDDGDCVVEVGTSFANGPPSFSTFSSFDNNAHAPSFSVASSRGESFVAGTPSEFQRTKRSRPGRESRETLSE
eukprot:438628-Amphidinium_carterae.2